MRLVASEADLYQINAPSEGSFLSVGLTMVDHWSCSFVGVNCEEGITCDRLAEMGFAPGSKPSACGLRESADESAIGSCLQSVHSTVIQPSLSWARDGFVCLVAWQRRRTQHDSELLQVEFIATGATSTDCLVSMIVNTAVATFWISASMLLASSWTKNPDGGHNLQSYLVLKCVSCTTFQ